MVGAGFGADAGAVCGAAVPGAGESVDGAGSGGAEGSGGSICLSWGYSSDMLRSVEIAAF